MFGICTKATLSMPFVGATMSWQSRSFAMLVQQTIRSAPGAVGTVMMFSIVTDE